MQSDSGEINCLSRFDELYRGNVRVPEPGVPLYKDECVYTFDTASSEDGLYICLQRHVGVSRPLLDLYMKNTKQNIFLHHTRKRRLIQDGKDENGQSKPKRLAIGVEGGFNPDAPIYEYDDTFTITVFPENIDIPYDISSLPDTLATCVERVLAAESASRAVEIKAQATTWDGEFRAISKHYVNLVQEDNGKTVPSSGWVCQYQGCNIKQGLWLCLSDGSIYCGRYMWDGSGGNNHAEEHYKKTSYPLVVKLGTINSEGGDVYSYPEDDMVIDPLLGDHLSKWGIDLGKMKKTEKTMAELEIEWNQKVGDISKVTESDKQLQDAFGPGFTGMENLGNSCYLNSIVQVFFSFNELKKIYYGGFQDICFGPQSLNRNPPEDFNIQFAKVAFGILSGRYSKPPSEEDRERQSIKPIMFKNVIGRNHVDFSTKQQQDAYEFLVHLLSTIERNPLDGFETAADYFKFDQEVRLQCAESLKYKLLRREDNSISFSIPLDKALNLDEVKRQEERKVIAESKGESFNETEVQPLVPLSSLIENYAQDELVDDVYSTALKRKGVMIKTTRFISFPKILVVRIDRFVISNDWGAGVKKLSASVCMPDEIDLSQGDLSLKAKDLRPGDELLPDETDEDNEIMRRLSEESKKKAAPFIDQNVVDELEAMGFPNPACRRAAYESGKRGLEAATEWIMSHMDDDDFGMPWEPPVAGSDNAPKKDVNLDQEVAQITDLGFTSAQALYALGKTSNNIERAVDYIFNHMEEIQNVSNEHTGNSSTNASNAPVAPSNSNEEKLKNGIQRFSSKSNGKYKLKAFITHMGPSTSSGHYVCHIRKKEQWVIFNDEKVAFSETPPKDLAYLYFYERCDE